MDQIGTIPRTKTNWNKVNVTLTDYRSVQALRYEPVHTRILLFIPKSPPFWSPTCDVIPCSRVSDRRIIGSIMSAEFIPSRFMDVVNAVAVDFTRKEMVKLIGFTPFELQSGQPFRFQYQFLLRGRDGRSW